MHIRRVSFCAVVLMGLTTVAAWGQNKRVVLAEGPREIVVYPLDLAGNRKTPVKATLFRLSTDELIYTYYNEFGMTTDAVRAGVGRVEAVEIPDPKKRWNCNISTRTFENVPLDPVAPPLDTASVAYDARQEGRYLYHRLVALHDILDREITREQPEFPDQLHELAKGYQARALEIGYPELARQYGDLKPNYAELQRFQATLKEVRTRYEKDLSELNAQKVQELRKAATDKSRANLLILAGGISALNDWSNYTPINKRDVRLVLAGEGLLQDAMDYEANTEEIFGAETKRLKARSESEYERAKSAYAAEWDAQRKVVADIGGRRFDLRDTKRTFETKQLVKDMSAKADLPYMLAALERWAAFERGGSGRDNPFRTLQVLDCKFALYVQGTEAKCRQRAGLLAEAVANVKLVPPHRAYDSDRVSLLFYAIGLANRIAYVDSRLECRYDKPHLLSLRQTYHPAALVALQLIREAKRYQIADTSRLVSEQEVYALAHAGELQAAARLVREIGQQLADNPRFQLFAARVLAANSENKSSKDVAEEVLARLDGVLKHDGSKTLTLSAVRSDPDLKTYGINKKIVALFK